MIMAYKTDMESKEVKRKAEQVRQTKAEMGKYKTVALLNLQKLPDSLFQSLRQRIRKGGGKVLVLKKPVILRVLQSNPKLAARAAECSKPVALILTDQSPYEINTFFKQNRKKRAAKIGDTAIEDIVVHEGETDLPPGPALSELKAGGVNAQIKAGKIVVAKESVVARKGEKLVTAKVKALQTLNVQPFEIMANMIFGFDGEYVYSREILDMGDTINADLASSLSQAMNFSLNAGYPTGQNIELLVTDALRQAMNISLNGDLYSSSTMERLLVTAIRQGTALSKLG
jgi:large subunit ribosomal protein L10